MHRRRNAVKVWADAGGAEHIVRADAVEIAVAGDKFHAARPPCRDARVGLVHILLVARRDQRAAVQEKINQRQIGDAEPQHGTPLACKVKLQKIHLVAKFGHTYLLYDYLYIKAIVPAKKETDGKCRRSATRVCKPSSVRGNPRRNHLSAQPVAGTACAYALPPGDICRADTPCGVPIRCCFG